MDPVLITIVVVAVIGLIVAGAIFAHRAAKQRREELTAWASSQGWAFDPDSRRDSIDVLERFSEFDQGSRRTAYNTMCGHLTVGPIRCSVQAGDFSYTTTSGTGTNRQTTTHRLSYLALQLPFAFVPDVRLRREGVFDKMSAAFGFDDIDFESEEFSREYHVTSKDRRFAFDLFHPRMIEFLLRMTPPRIEIVDGYACFTQGARTWQVSQFDWQLEFVREFLRLWPEHLVDQLAP